MKKFFSIIIIFLLVKNVSAQDHLNQYLTKPDHFTAKGYDSHVELRWPDLKNAVSYRLYAATDSAYQLRTETKNNYYLDFVTDLGRNISLKYKLVPVNRKGKELTSETVEAKASIHDFTDEELMNMVQKYTFRYFWNFGRADLGMAREHDNHPDGDIVTIGGSGFGVMALMVGVKHGWITREQAVDRLLNLTKFLKTTDRFHGMWAHWYNADTQKAYHFSKYDDGGDIVESSFMMEGLLAARRFFNHSTPKEKFLQQQITDLWKSMDWNFYTRGQDVLYWHWSPNYGWKMNHPIHGYNECLITYILAASSPDHAISPEVYHKGWAGNNWDTFANNSTYYGMMLPLGNRKWMGGPLFFAHYSYMGLDPKGLRDRYANYWQQNKRQTLINRAYCIDNPYGWKGYGPDFWGLTAGDKVPDGYTAHAPGFERDLGTITPTAALSSMPYTPKESMEVLKNLYRNYGKYLFGPFGFYDGINLSVGNKPEDHVRKTYLAIDQGPIVVMIENYRSGLVWNSFMKNEDVLKGLKRLDFTIDNKPIRVDEKK